MKKRLIIALILIAITIASLFLYRNLAEEADSGDSGIPEAAHSGQ